MRYTFFFLFIIFLFSACSHKNQLTYINNTIDGDLHKINVDLKKNFIQPGDILKIDVTTLISEAAIPYSKISSSQDLEILKLQGYLVSEKMTINFPELGKISVLNLDLNGLEIKIKKLLVEGGHLSNPNVIVRRVNSKFTVLGEVRNPGTFSFYDNNINLFQALGYAGDLTINGKRRDIILLREENGLRKSHKISLLESDLLSSPYYFIKNNDVIIVEPNFSTIKSAGFIGSAQSIGSLASLLLSITLLIINK